jgi:hypothetical protein
VSATVDETPGVLGTPGTVVINLDSEASETSDVPLLLIATAVNV